MPHKSITKKIQSEYHHELFDTNKRKRNAHRLHDAFQKAGLWKKDLHILDIGTGTGLLADNLGKDIRHLCGCDFRKDLFLDVKPYIKHLDFVQADGHFLPFRQNSFEMVLCLGAIEEFQDWKKAIGEMARCLAPNGIIYITITNGNFLILIYKIAEKLGFQIKKSWWIYAQNSLPIIKLISKNGFNIDEMSNWELFDLTPYLLRSQFPILNIIPKTTLEKIAKLISPSIGYALKKLGHEEP